jgi:hypothetical protein
MPTERLSKRKIRQVLHLRLHLKLNKAGVAASCDIGTTTVWEYFRRAV